MVEAVRESMVYDTSGNALPMDEEHLRESTVAIYNDEELKRERETARTKLIIEEKVGPYSLLRFMLV